MSRSSGLGAGERPTAEAMSSARSGTGAPSEGTLANVSGVAGPALSSVSVSVSVPPVSYVSHVGSGELARGGGAATSQTSSSSSSLKWEEALSLTKELIVPASVADAAAESSSAPMWRKSVENAEESSIGRSSQLSSRYPGRAYAERLTSVMSISAGSAKRTWGMSRCSAPAAASLADGGASTDAGSASGSG